MCGTRSLNMLVMLAVWTFVALPAQAADAPVTVKVPMELSSWELMVEVVYGAHADRPPISIRSDGRFEYKSKSLGPETIYRGTLKPEDCSKVFAAGRDAINRLSFAGYVKGQGTHDAGMYRLRLATGTRAITILMDEDIPARFGFDASFTDGIKVLNRTIQPYLKTSFYEYPEPFKATQKQHKVRSSPQLTIPETSPDWYRVDFNILVPNKKHYQMVVFNPEDNLNDVHRRGYKKMKDGMEIVIAEPNSKIEPKPHSWEISRENRDAVFADVSAIVNQFTLTNSPDNNTQMNPVFIIGIEGWLRRLEVEFLCDNSLGNEWRDRLTRIMELAHLRDNEFPTMKDLTNEQ